MLFVVAGSGLAPAQRDFVGQSHRLFELYRWFRSPVDARSYYRSGDPAMVERRRRNRVMLQAAERFDPKGFDRYAPGFTQRYRDEFLYGARLFADGHKKYNTTRQIKGSSKMGDFVIFLRMAAPKLFPKDFDKPLPVPTVWKPPKRPTP